MLALKVCSITPRCYSSSFKISFLYSPAVLKEIVSNTDLTCHSLLKNIRLLFTVSHINTKLLMSPAYHIFCLSSLIKCFTYGNYTWSFPRRTLLEFLTEAVSNYSGHGVKIWKHLRDNHLFKLKTIPAETLQIKLSLFSCNKPKHPGH